MSSPTIGLGDGAEAMSWGTSLRRNITFYKLLSIALERVLTSVESLPLALFLGTLRR